MYLAYNIYFIRPPLCTAAGTQSSKRSKILRPRSRRRAKSVVYNKDEK